MTRKHKQANQAAGTVAIAISVLNIINMYLLTHDTEYNRWMDRMADKAVHKIAGVFKRH